jgi:soluble lytic murein transglycosylase
MREAARVLDALPDARKLSPEVRYVRARVALALGDAKSARPLLVDLEKDLPILAREIVRDRAESELEVGPYLEAAKVFSALPDAASATKAALAYERAAQLQQARIALDRALRILGADDGADATATRIKTRAARARVLTGLGDIGGSAVELRWLATEAPDSEPGKTAEAQLLALKPPIKLTSEQRLAAAKKLAESGEIERALAVIDEVSAHPDPTVSTLALVRARGSAYYASRANYQKAAELLEEAVRLGGDDRARDAFYAARAYSRAQNDALAIERYEAMARRFPTSSFAEEAEYQAARLRMLLGKWDEATLAYGHYLDRYGKGKRGRFAAASRYELAISRLGAKHPEEAAKIFGSLADAENETFARANLRELEGAALAESGQKDKAIERLTAVVRERPLSFAALTARARLSALGGPAPGLEPALAVDPVPLALTVELPAKTLLFSRLGLVADAEKDLATHEGEFFAKYAPRGSEALCEAYGKIGAGAARFRVGRSAVKNDVFERVPTDATRWAWDCVYPTPYVEVVRDAESLRGLPLGLLHAVMRQESGFRADAVSPAHAVGLLQLIPGTARRVAEELHIEAVPELLRHPAYNVELGSFYLKKVLERFSGHVALAAAAYNAGPQAVSRWLESGESLPLDVWVARIPFLETRGYVVRVVGNLAHYAYLSGGEAAVPKLSLDMPQGVRAGATDY